MTTIHIAMCHSKASVYLDEEPPGLGTTYVGEFPMHDEELVQGKFHASNWAELKRLEVLLKIVGWPYVIEDMT